MPASENLQNRGRPRSQKFFAKNDTLDTMLNLLHKIFSLFSKKEAPTIDPHIVIDYTPPPVLKKSPPLQAKTRPFKRKITKCLHKDKLMFTREEAAANLVKQKKEHPAVHLRIYCCPFCSSWHLTHLRLNTRRKK